MTTAVMPREVNFSVNGVSLHGLDWGGAAGATPMILLHGCGSNAWTWGKLPVLLRQALGDAYRIVAIDQRGCGDSDKPRSGYEPAEFAKDVLEIQDQLGGQPMVVVGHSRGGWLAAYIAGRWPERVSKVVLVDPARITFANSADADEFYGAVRRNLGPFESREAALEFMRNREPRAVQTPEREHAFLFGLREQADGSYVGKMPDRVVDELRRVREESDAVGPLLPNVTMPVLLFVATTSNEWRQGQKLEYKRRLPQAEVEFLDGTHALHLDMPEDVASRMVTFLGKGA